MKKIVVLILLTIFLTLEILFLYNKNNEYRSAQTELSKKIASSKSSELLKEEKKDLETRIKELFVQETASLDNAYDTIDEEKLVNENLNNEIVALEDSIKLLEGNLTELQHKYDKLLKKESNNTFYITGVAFINQYPDYPTGCESVSLAILLNYYGIDISPLDIINNLPKGSLPYNKDGITYGGDPEREFVGDPLTTNSYGVYEKPLAEIATKYKDGIIIGTGMDFDQILEVVKQGRPVVVWTSMNLSIPYISKSWIYEPTGEKIHWKSGEHAVVVIGYTENKIIISDPIGGKIKYQSRSIFEERYNYFGKKALYY